jgi:hypothetical protein
MKTRDIYQKIIFLIYGLSILLFLISDLFNTSLSNWIYERCGGIFVSFGLIFISLFIGVLSKKEIFGRESFTEEKFGILLLQILLALSVWNVSVLAYLKKNIWSEINGYTVLGIMISPTVIYILRTFFLRFIKIAENLEYIAEKAALTSEKERLEKEKIKLQNKFELLSEVRSEIEKRNDQSPN